MLRFRQIEPIQMVKQVCVLLRHRLHHLHSLLRSGQLCSRLKHWQGLAVQPADETVVRDGTQPVIQHFLGRLRRLGRLE